MAHATVDVVVATRDRPAPLVRCLEALARQTHTEFGVVVVDDGSARPVDTVVPAALREQLRLRVLRRTTSGGPARARNEGVRASEAPYVAFVDDDVCAHPALLARHLAAIERGGRGTVSIGPLLAPGDWRPTPWNRWEAEQLAKEYGRMQRGEYAPTWRQFHTGNACLERRDFLAAGGFDERFTRAEDIELGLRLWEGGCHFTFEPEAIGWHYADRRLEAWLNIPRAYGRYDVVIDALHPQVGWLEVLRRELDERHPWLRAVRGPLGHRAVRPAARQAAVLLARGLASAGVTRPAMRALSLVYELEYRAALSEALARPPVLEGPAPAAVVA